MDSFQLRILAALLVGIPVFVIAAPAAVPKVQIALYYESYCGGCKDFIGDQLYPTFQKIGQIMDVTLVPYGNAEEYRRGAEWTYTCQHGPQECVGNLIETCAISILKNESAYLPFIHCFEGNVESGDPLSVGQKCAQQQGIDFTVINKCQSGIEGNSLEHEMALKTNALEPRHSYVPWITLNGKHTENIQSEATFDLLGLVCDSYQGIKPSACSEERPLKGRCYKKA